MSEDKPDLSGLPNLMAQLHDISYALSANFQLQEAVASMSRIREQLIDSLGPLLELQLQTQETLESLSRSMGNLTQPLIDNFRNQIENLVSPTFNDFFESFQLLPVRTQTALMTLGNHGWFFDLKMPLTFLWELDNALNEGNTEEAEAALVSYFQENLSAIESRLNAKYPHRVKLISKAFDAHRRGDYELSIPILLAQTDGICFEVINHYLFIRKNKRPSTAEYVDAIASNAFRQALLSPLSQPLPISASESERDKSFDGLNRHQIMHGESLDYGTEVNSLKSISLLNYVAQVLRLDDKDEI